MSSSRAAELKIGDVFIDRKDRPSTVTWVTDQSKGIEGDPRLVIIDYWYHRTHRNGRVEKQKKRIRYYRDDLVTRGDGS